MSKRSIFAGSVTCALFLIFTSTDTAMLAQSAPIAQMEGVKPET